MRTVDDKVVVALHQIRDAIKNKDCCNGGGESDSSSKKVTIDDVVKFMHDNWTFQEPEFPYTTYDEIPDVPSDPVITEENIGDIYKGELLDISRLRTNLSVNSVEVSIFFQVPANYYIAMIVAKEAN